MTAKTLWPGERSDWPSVHPRGEQRKTLHRGRCCRRRAENYFTRQARPHDGLRAVLVSCRTHSGIGGAHPTGYRSRWRTRSVAPSGASIQRLPCRRRRCRKWSLILFRLDVLKWTCCLPLALGRSPASACMAVIPSCSAGKRLLAYGPGRATREHLRSGAA